MSLRTEYAFNKHLEMCNDTGKRTFYNNDYLKFDKFHYRNRIPFPMCYDFECVIKNRKHGGASVKVAPPLVGETTLALPPPLRGWTNSHIPLKEDSITPLYSSCYYCNEYMDNDIVRYS